MESFYQKNVDWDSRLSEGMEEILPGFKNVSADLDGVAFPQHVDENIPLKLAKKESRGKREQAFSGMSGSFLYRFWCFQRRSIRCWCSLGARGGRPC